MGVRADVEDQDDARKVVKPKIQKFGGDPRRCYVPDAPLIRSFNAKKDLLWLEHQLQELKIKFIVFDPLSDFLHGFDNYNNDQVRQALNPLGLMLRRTGCTALAILHNRKPQQGERAVDKPLGSRGHCLGKIGS